MTSVTDLQRRVRLDVENESKQSTSSSSRFSWLPTFRGSPFRREMSPVATSIRARVFCRACVSCFLLSSDIRQLRDLRPSASDFFLGQNRLLPSRLPSRLTYISDLDADDVDDDDDDGSALIMMMLIMLAMTLVIAAMIMIFFHVFRACIFATRVFFVLPLSFSFSPSWVFPENGENLPKS